jgi:transposase
MEIVEMPNQFKLRELTETEIETLDRISRSRTAARREVERAQMVKLWREGKRAEAIAQQVGRTATTVYYQLHQFNQRGLDFLQDMARVGRPLTYDEKQRGEIVKAAKTNPQHLDLAFGHWTLDLLVDYVNQELEIAISRSQLGEVLKQEGLKWYQEKTYFSESPDPQFVEKRGRL